jgi:hypothetical protein
MIRLFAVTLTLSALFAAYAYAAITCPNCGTENANHNITCDECGRPLPTRLSRWAVGGFVGVADPFGGWPLDNYDFSFTFGGKAMVGLMPGIELDVGTHWKHTAEESNIIIKVVPITIGGNAAIMSLSVPGVRKAAYFYISLGAGDYIWWEVPSKEPKEHRVGGYGGFGIGLQTGRLMVDVIPRLHIVDIKENPGAISFFGISLGVNYVI